MSKNKKVIVIIITVIILIVGVAITIHQINLRTLSKENTLSKEEIVENAEKIFWKNLGDKPYITFEYIREKVNYMNEHYYMEYIDQTKTDEFIIYTSGGGSIFRRYYDPNEITALFESFLYFQTKQTYDNLLAIYASFTTGGLSNYHSSSVIVFKQEFEELRDTTDIEGFSREKAAKKLAQKWIEQTGYVKG